MKTRTPILALATFLLAGATQAAGPGMPGTPGTEWTDLRGIAMEMEPDTSLPDSGHGFQRYPDYTAEDYSVRHYLKDPRTLIVEATSVHYPGILKTATISLTEDSAFLGDSAEDYSLTHFLVRARIRVILSNVHHRRFHRTFVMPFPDVRVQTIRKGRIGRTGRIPYAG